LDNPKILIVEDDLELSEMLNVYFRVQKYEVHTAAWGEDAINLSREVDLALIMLDIRLPDIDGYEVCRQLRQQRRTQDIPILFLTEKRDRVDKLQGLQLGVVDYITKPFDIQELHLRVRNAITRANRQALANPVTDLPEGAMVDDRLAALLDDESDWALLQITIRHLGRFRELYGFVAADDVLRAVTLMLRNAIEEHGTPEDYIGHTGPEDFVIITRAALVEEIRARVQSRVEQSREYFYPLQDRDKARQALEADYLSLASAVIDHSAAPFADLDALKNALADAG
jgi:DNA-binding response OmpR family regulator